LPGRGLVQPPAPGWGHFRTLTERGLAGAAAGGRPARRGRPRQQAYRGPAGARPEGQPVTVVAPQRVKPVARVRGPGRRDITWSDLVSGVRVAEVGARLLPPVTTLYRVASITKTFTGTAIMQLCQAGRLHLDDPAVAHLPELRQAASPFGPIETVSIRRMLSHESGLASDPPGTDWAVPGYEGVVERTLRRVADIGTKVPANAA
jgi:CubicO group peptidase (beta-lactamase class C family)